MMREMTVDKFINVLEELCGKGDISYLACNKNIEVYSRKTDGLIASIPLDKRFEMMLISKETHGISEESLTKLLVALRSFAWTPINKR